LHALLVRFGARACAVAAVAAGALLIQCSSSDGSGDSPPTTAAAAFLGTWSCTEVTDVTYTSPSGTPPYHGTEHATEILSSTGADGILDRSGANDPCPTHLVVTGTTATVAAGQSCPSANVTSESGTLTLTGDSLSGTLTATVSATVNGAQLSGTGTITVSCTKGAVTDGGNGSGGTSSGGAVNGASGGTNGGSGGASGSDGGTGGLVTTGPGAYEHSGPAGTGGKGPGGCVLPGNDCGAVSGECCTTGPGIGADGASCPVGDLVCHAWCKTNVDCKSGCCALIQDGAGLCSPPSWCGSDAGPGPAQGPACGSYMGAPSLGTCVPSASAPTLNALYWTADTCPAGDLCVATTKAQDPTRRFASCTTSQGPGECWPDYVLEGVVAGIATQFTRGTCAAGEDCMPCTNTVAPTLKFCLD
jgi:hypothetical protein